MTDEIVNLGIKISESLFFFYYSLKTGDSTLRPVSCTCSVRFPIRDTSISVYVRKWYRPFSTTRRARQKKCVATTSRGRRSRLGKRYLAMCARDRRGRRAWNGPRSRSNDCRRARNRLRGRAEFITNEIRPSEASPRRFGNSGERKIPIPRRKRRENVGSRWPGRAWCRTRNRRYITHRFRGAATPGPVGQSGHVRLRYVIIAATGIYLRWGYPKQRNTCCDVIVIFVTAPTRHSGNNNNNSNVQRAPGPTQGTSRHVRTDVPYVERNKKKKINNKIIKYLMQISGGYTMTCRQ
jgi:hypothetical protein